MFGTLKKKKHKHVFILNRKRLNLWRIIVNSKRCFEYKTNFITRHENHNCSFNVVRVSSLMTVQSVLEWHLTETANIWYVLRIDLKRYETTNTKMFFCTAVIAYVFFTAVNELTRVWRKRRTPSVSPTTSPTWWSRITRTTANGLYAKSHRRCGHQSGRAKRVITHYERFSPLIIIIYGSRHKPDERYHHVFAHIIKKPSTIGAFDDIARERERVDIDVREMGSTQLFQSRYKIYLYSPWFPLFFISTPDYVVYSCIVMLIIKTRKTMHWKPTAITHGMYNKLSIITIGEKRLFILDNGSKKCKNVVKHNLLIIKL